MRRIALFREWQMVFGVLACGDAQCAQSALYGGTSGGVGKPQNELLEATRKSEGADFSVYQYQQERDCTCDIGRETDTNRTPRKRISAYLQATEVLF